MMQADFVAGGRLGEVTRVKKDRTECREVEHAGLARSLVLTPGAEEEAAGVGGQVVVTATAMPGPRALRAVDRRAGGREEARLADLDGRRDLGPGCSENLSLLSFFFFFFESFVVFIVFFLLFIF